jgi:hypothetical protein
MAGLVPAIAFLSIVMPGLDPGIHVFGATQRSKTWMAGSSRSALRPAMTKINRHASPD